jgi:ubiquinol-cytochrome c reductase cytochrome b subunit
MPIYMAKAGGFFFIVFGVTALMGGLLSINPVWRYGPYNPAEVTAGSQPDWYMGVAEGLLRIFPGLETHIFGVTISWNVMLPAQILPFVIFGGVLAYPFIEAWITGDKREHHLLERPRNAPNRTAFLVMFMTAYGLLWAAGGNDILATTFHMNLNEITYFMRVAVFVIPPIAFVITRRWCISLQRADENRLLHGYETGVIMRSAEGGYSERHAPISLDEAYTLTARERDQVYAGSPETDANGVRGKGLRVLDKARARASKYWFGDNVQKPTAEELEEAHHHAELEPGWGEPDKALVAADGHQYDGRHEMGDDHLDREH